MAHSISAEDPVMDMTQTTQTNTELQNQPVPPKDETVLPETKKRWQQFKSRIETCKQYRRKLIASWSVNIDYRRGKPFASQADEDRIAVNLDWSLTKTKHATLFSQVPQIRLNHPPETLELGPWIVRFEQRVNDALRVAGIESAMDEVLPDVINASGIGAVLVSYEAITEDKEVPLMDPSTVPPEFQEEFQTSNTINGEPIEMTTVPIVRDKRYLITRISPSDLLWDTDFTGSDFDNAAWLGRSGKLEWAQAVNLYKLSEDEKDKLVGDSRTVMDKLSYDSESERNVPNEKINFDEIFYQEYKYDSTAKSFSTIHHLLFIDGKDDPVIDEQWKGQRLEEDSILGCTKLPIRVLTLSYITDDTIPPSDSAIGRPQIDELNKSRGQIITHRDHNIPIRWFDVNRVDPTIQHSLIRGTWSAMIPVQGAGDKVLGEVSKSSMPQENFLFDNIIKQDLTEAWSIGANQLGSGNDVETKGEGDLIESNFQTRIGRERAKVGKFFCTIAEILGGLLVLYEDPAAFGEGFDPAICKTLGYSITADSSVLLDSNQRLERLINFVNFGAKSGWVNLEPVFNEIAQLSGLDPASVIRPPQPEPPVKPNISLRITGAEDLMNPLVYAFLLKSGQAPEPELIEQAKQHITMVVIPAPPPPPPMTEVNSDGSTSVVEASQPEAQAPVLEGMQITLQPVPVAPAQDPSMPQDPNMPPTPPQDIVAQPPAPPPPPIGGANPDYGLMPHVSQRAEDGGEVQ